MFDIEILTSVSNNINRIKKKNHGIIPMDAEKSSGKKLNAHLYEKRSMRIDVERNFNVINVIYKKPTANVIPDNRILTKKKESLFIPLLFNIILEIVTNAVYE